MKSFDSAPRFIASYFPFNLYNINAESWKSSVSWNVGRMKLELGVEETSCMAEQKALRQYMA